MWPPTWHTMGEDKGLVEMAGGRALDVVVVKDLVVAPVGGSAAPRKL